MPGIERNQPTKKKKRRIQGAYLCVLFFGFVGRGAREYMNDLMGDKIAEALVVLVKLAAWTESHHEHSGRLVWLQQCEGPDNHRLDWLLEGSTFGEATNFLDFVQTALTKKETCDRAQLILKVVFNSGSIVAKRSGDRGRQSAQRSILLNKRVTGDLRGRKGWRARDC